MIARYFKHSKFLRFMVDVKTWCPALVALGYPDYTTGDFCENFEALMKKIIDGTISTSKQLVDEFASEMSDYYVVAAR